MSHLVGQNGLSATGSQLTVSHNIESNAVPYMPMGLTIDQWPLAKGTKGLLAKATNEICYQHVFIIGELLYQFMGLLVLPVLTNGLIDIIFIPICKQGFSRS